MKGPYLSELAELESREAEAQKRLEESERNRKRLELGLPIQEWAQQQVEALLKLAEPIVTARIYERLLDIVQLKENADNLILGLKEVAEALETIETTDTSLKNTLLNMANQVASNSREIHLLIQRWNGELDTEAELRELERETLEKINQYLQRWI